MATSRRKTRRTSTRSARKPKPRQRTKRGGVGPSSRSHYSSKSSRATDGMSVTELQIMAKQRGIMFAGLSKQKLIERINKYTK